jgi:NTP pyrophosphatase (non-canonical NTP hydrolase)
MAGEAGEACNLIKKMRRGDHVNLKQVADELADLVIYADLLAARLDINLGAAVVDKFNEVSAKKKVEHYLLTLD